MKLPSTLVMDAPSQTPTCSTIFSVGTLLRPPAEPAAPWADVHRHNNLLPLASTLQSTVSSHNSVIFHFPLQLGRPLKEDTQKHDQPQPAVALSSPSEVKERHRDFAQQLRRFSLLVGVRGAAGILVQNPKQSQAQYGLQWEDSYCYREVDPGRKSKDTVVQRRGEGR